MNITPGNYNESFQLALSVADPLNQFISELPEALQKGHEFVLEATESLRDWEIYEADADIKRTVDLYFSKLSDFITAGDNSPSTSAGKNQRKASEKPPAVTQLVKKSQSDKLGERIYRDLEKLMPGLTNFIAKEKKEKGYKISKGDVDLYVNVHKDKQRVKKGTFTVVLADKDLVDDGKRYFIEADRTNRIAHVFTEYIDDKEEDGNKHSDNRCSEFIQTFLNQGFVVDLSGDQEQDLDTTNKSKNNFVTDKYVEHITEEVKFIKRYVGLHNKEKSRSSILAFIKSLQRSIVQKLIRKTSPFADEIRAMQEKLVDAYNKIKGDALRLTINPTDLSRLVEIAGGEEVYRSIKIIKRYVGLQGREVDEKSLEAFLKQIQNAIKTTKISQDDPYYDEVKGIQSSVKKLVNGTKVKIGKAELHGLEGILSGCGCMDKSPTTGRKNKGLGSITPGVMSAEQMANLTVEELNFTYPWDMLLGKPATNFSVMFHGDPGSGKTTLLLKFVEYLANIFGKVLYVSSEEHGASTLVKKINALLPVRPSRLDFAANLSAPDLSEYDFIVLDSVNNLKLKLDDFKQLKKDYPHTSFIVVLQHTKEGNYRGGKDWEHDIEMAVKVEQGIATVYRTRYGVYGTLDFFSHFNITPEMFK